MSRLNDSQIHTLTLLVPKGGDWRADIVLDGGPLPTGTVTLVVNDLQMTGSVLRADFDAADRPHAIVVGALGWQSLVTSPVSLQSSSGIRLKTVLGILSRTSGQTITQPDDRTIGDHFEIGASRPGEPIRWVDVLNDLVRLGHVTTWYVDIDGVTKFTSRVNNAVPSEIRATLMRHDTAIGLYTFGIDSPKSFLPGNTVDGIPISKLVLREVMGKMEADVYSGDLAKSPPSIRELLRRMFPDAPEKRPDTYVVSSVNSDGTLDLVPPADARHLPEIKRAEQWTAGGIRHAPLPGKEVMVLYRDYNRTRPVVFAIELDDTPFAGVARLGDTVTVLLPPATFSGTIGGSPATGMVVWAPGQTTGTIVTSSARTKAGP